MNSRKTLFLVVLAGIIGGLVVCDQFKGTTTSDRELQSKRILNLDTKQVSHFELARSNQTIVLEKTVDNWDIKQPIAVRADSSAVNATLDTLEFAERSRTLTAKDLQGVNLASFGLVPPRASIKLQAKSGPVTLLIGNETPMKNALYVQVAGRREVCVAPSSLYDNATQNLDTLRSRTTIEFTPTSVTRLEIKTAGRVIELKKSDSRWTIMRPLTARADQDKISELLSGLASLRVLDFVSEDPKDLHTFHLDEPDREVTIFTGETGTTLLLGRSPTNDTGKVYAKLKNNDSIFTIASEPAKRFAVQINDLRDLRLLAFEPATVTSIAIAHGVDTLAIHRDAQGWKLTTPVSVAAEEAMVTRLLDDLSGMRAKRFVADVTTEPQRYGLATPIATVTLTGAGTNIFLIGSVDESNTVRFVKCVGEEFIYGVAADLLEQLPANYAALRSRSVCDFTAEKITQLVAGDVTVARESDKWKLVAPSSGTLDTNAVDAVVATLAKLRAVSFGRPKTEQDAGLGYSIKATIGDITHWLTVATTGQAAASNVELTFQLPATSVTTLTRSLLVTTP